jgi:hypothetical protein
MNPSLHHQFQDHHELPLFGGWQQEATLALVITTVIITTTITTFHNYNHPPTDVKHPKRRTFEDSTSRQMRHIG